MDTIRIRNIVVETHLGVHSDERAHRQPVIIDVVFMVDATKTAQTDHMDDSVCYRSLSTHIMQFVSHARYHLIETLAHHTALSIIQAFQIPWVELTLKKPNALRSEHQDVSITLSRSR